MDLKNLLEDCGFVGHFIHAVICHRLKAGTGVNTKTLPFPFQVPNNCAISAFAKRGAAALPRSCAGPVQGL